ncbi:MalY/PatB family protein [Alkalitalea saponilacus]|uniref:cysteine-S-conjugate beta-lyase n=1 Tax=Alkalitalea saponilacus TaxID=889453 RepID=A0A1T5HBK5_9BACT|nr:PatB family C-S lyase [Alkalitalea saponilacus]ASB50768.1 cystathionine beta-lyase [Alkalitalea saponilacus]SKC18058.1 cystathione beta-lyase [Alkalitalea saponilacus]
MSQFDTILNREETRSIKLEYRERLYGSSDVIPLWVADMDFAAPPAVQEAIVNRTKHPIYGYTNRPKPFFEAIQNWLSRRFNWEVDQSWIEFSPGVVPNLGLAVQAFTKPGEGVIIQPPVYPPFFGVVKDFDREVVENPLIEQQEGYYVMDYDHLEEVASKPENKLLLLCHPHNPVGRVWTTEELIRMGEICKKHNVIIISDEIHCDLVLYGNKHIPLATISPELAEITLTCMAPSKTFNLAGFSTSYMISSNPDLLKAARAQVMGYHLHMGNTFGALALEAAYNHSEYWLEELIDYIEGNMDFVTDFIKTEMPEVKARKPEATYLLWMDFRSWKMKSTELKNFMVNEAGLGLNDGVTFGKEGRGFMRMNLASPRSVIEKAMTQMKSARDRMQKV